MKIMIICIVLGVSTIAAHAATTQVVHLNGSTENVTPATPQQLEVNKQINNLNAEADIAVNKGKYAEAEADVREADALAPGGYVDCGNHGTLAAALEAQGKDNEALEEYKKLVVDGSSSIPDFCLPYALLMLKNGHYSQAAAAYNKALPNLPYGNLLRSQGEFAMDTPQPNEFEVACHLALGLVYYDHGIVGADSRHDLALDQFQRARQLSANPALAELYSGYAFKWLHLYKQAHDALVKAQELGQENVRKQAAAAIYGTSIDP